MEPVLERVRPFTERQREVHDLLALGLSREEISKRLGIAPQTVGNHARSVYSKLGISGYGQVQLMMLKRVAEERISRPPVK